MHRFTLLGWLWPLTRQLAQLAVLVFVFSSVLNLGIDNYPVFVFSGLIAWSWFSSGILRATSSLVAQRHLVFQPKFPAVVLPVVAVAVPLIDVAMALPVLLAMLLWSGELHWTIVFLPALLAVQLLLMCGLGWLAAAANVYLRDVGNIVGVGMLMLFYLTPVFYDYSRVPPDLQWVLRLNPMGTLIEADRAVLLGGAPPPFAELAPVVVGSAVLAAAGLVFFLKVRDGLVDEL